MKLFVTAGAAPHNPYLGCGHVEQLGDEDFDGSVRLATGRRGGDFDLQSRTMDSDQRGLGRGRLHEHM